MESVPLHAGASGKALLAFGPPGLTRRVLSHPLERRTEFTTTVPERLQVELHRIRRQGYALERQELVRGYAAASVPVSKEGVALAALTLVGPLSRFDPDAWVEQLRHEAAKLAQNQTAFSSL